MEMCPTAYVYRYRETLQIEEVRGRSVPFPDVLSILFLRVM
jgi:hypothetical protein